MEHSKNEIFCSKKGGDCLSSSGMDVIKNKWVCSKGHKWDQTPSNIIQGGHGVEDVRGRTLKLIKLKN